MIKKSFLTIIFASQLFIMEAQSSPAIEKEKDDLSGLVSGVIGSAVVDATKANDYLCGSLVVQVADNWRIKSIRVNQGSIQNQFQFKQHSSDTDLYLPNGLGDNFLQIRQSTGFSNQSRLYVASYPIDFVIKLAQEGQFNEVSYRVTKKTCNSLQVGGVKVTHTEGNVMDYVLKNSERNDSTWMVH